MPPTDSPPPPELSVEEIVASLGDISVEAYYFLQAAVHEASDQVHGRAKKNSDASRHVTGRQLCETLRDMAIERWGMMASAVLGIWGVHCTRDFGRIVFAFVDAGHWHKTPTDSIDDFTEVYSFREAFDQRFKITLREKIG